MKPNKINHNQGRLFQQRLSFQLNPSHELFQLSKLIEWDRYEKEFANFFVEKIGSPGKPIRLITGILMLQHMYGYSDEGAIEEWMENPYWQFFCGYDYLQWEKPVDSSSLPRWRKRLGTEGLEKILQETIRAGIKAGAVSTKSLGQVIVDTTIMEKNIAFPTDSKLYHSGIKTLVRMAKNNEIELRQTNVHIFIEKSFKKKFAICTCSSNETSPKRKKQTQNLSRESFSRYSRATRR